MLFLMTFCWLILVFSLLVFALVMRKRLSHPMLLGICIVSFVISAFFPLRHVLCNPFLKELVSVTALREKNDASLGTDVVIRYIDSNYSERSIDNPINGKWAWWDGTYRWSEEWERQGLAPTDTIVMEVPVGSDRSITFSAGPNYGKAEITCLGTVQVVDLYRVAEELLPIDLPDSQHGVFMKDMLLRTAAFAGMDFLVIIAVTVLAVFINRKTNWRVFLKWKYEALVFILSLINVIVMGWYPNVVDYPVSYYLMPYENGFNSRGLTGTLAIFLGGPYIKQDELATFIFVVLVLSYLFFSVLITKQAKSESDWRVGLFWVLLYLLSPLTFLQVFDDARPDIYLIILFLVGVVLINKKRYLQIIPILCVLMVLINETSCAFFVAPMLALLLYSFLKERDVSYLISLVSSAGFTCATVLGILHLDKRKLMPLDDFFEHMSRHTNISLNYAAFSAEYKSFDSTVSGFAYEMGNQFHPNNELLVHSILFFILAIPLVILFIILWKAVYRKIMLKYADRSTSVLMVKYLYWVLVLSSCGGLVCMLIAYDYLRFAEFIMIASLANMFTLIRKERLSLQIGDLYMFMPPKRAVPLVPFAILLYVNFWGVVNVWPTDTQFLWTLARILEGLFGL